MCTLNTLVVDLWHIIITSMQLLYCCTHIILLACIVLRLFTSNVVISCYSLFIVFARLDQCNMFTDGTVIVCARMRTMYQLPELVPRLHVSRASVQTDRVPRQLESHACSLYSLVSTSTSCMCNRSTSKCRGWCSVS